MAWNTLDLNLLLALEALLAERSVTGAAKRLGLSQPALSASLARLRRHYDDDLLTRVGNHYELTPLAARLQVDLRPALRMTRLVVSSRTTFEPAEAEREFVVRVSDYVGLLLGGAIANMMATELPRASLRMLHNSSDAVDRRGEMMPSIDLLLLPHGFFGGLSHQDLFEDDWVVIVADTNTEIGPEISVEQLAASPWAVTYSTSTAYTPAIRRLMGTLGITPREAVVCESFVTTGALVADSERIALVPRRLAEYLGRMLPIRALACPFDAGPLRMAAWWHPTHDLDPGHQYFRDLVRRASDLLPATT